jgi:hypothetical protein
MATPKPASYQVAVTVCDAAIDAACPCVPVAAPPFGTAICVLAEAAGVQGCPQGYPASHSFGEGIADMRTCTGCGGAPTGVTCDNTMAVSLPPTCMGGGPGLAWSFGCEPASTPFGISLAPFAKGGTCPASGPAQSNGMLAPATVHTVCCAS